MPTIVIAEAMPFPVELMVFEEDTYRVLSAGNHIREIREPLNELQREAEVQEPHRVGELVVRGSRAFAIVHDFNQPEPFNPHAVNAALAELVSHVAEAGLTAIGLQPLGHNHGTLSREETVRLIEKQEWPPCLQRIWITLATAP